MSTSWRRNAHLVELAHELGRREPPATVAQHTLVHPPEHRAVGLYGLSRFSGRPELVKTETRSLEREVEHVVVGGSVEVEIREHVDPDAPAELRERPPHRAAFRGGGEDRGGVLAHHGRHEDVVDHREVGPFQLAGAGPHVGRELRGLRGDDVGHDEDVEPAECSRETPMVGQIERDVSAGDEQRAQVARLDLVGHRRARVLAEPGAQLRATRRSRRTRARRRQRRKVVAVPLREEARA